MPVTGQIQVKIPVDPVELVVTQAYSRFQHGEELYKQGFLKNAREEFDGAIDLLLATSRVYPKDPHLERAVTDLVARVYAIELSAIRDGDGLADQNEEHAAIDDLKHVETFPTTIDPELKREVEDDIKDITHDLPIEINDRVLGLLNYYQNGRGHATIERGLERVGRYQPMIEQILREEGVPLDLIYLCQAESAFQPRALSRAKAKGLWQFISSRGKEYGLRQTWWIDERSDPEKSTRAAARHLKDLYQEFGDWYLAMAAYNAGPVRVQRAMEKTGSDNFWKLADKRALPRETINYVPTILALTIIGKNPEKYGFSVEPEAPLETDRVTVDKPTDLRVISEAIDLPLEELRGLNTHILRWTTPPDDPEFQLILPKGYAERFNQQISSLPASKRVLIREHVVRRGDTIGAVAKKYGTSITQLALANDLGKQRVLRVGQTLIVPMSELTPPQSVSKRVLTVPVRKATYTVRRGDTLSRIAGNFHTSVENLKAWNHLRSTRLTVGENLVVSGGVLQTAPSSPLAKKVSSSPPAKKLVHQVRQGETLVKIATTYNTSVDAILSWNDTNDLSVIHPGDRITIFLDENNR
jgi:membrane-bound lytic murein transglycosylase D